MYIRTSHEQQVKQGESLALFAVYRREGGRQRPKYGTVRGMQNCTLLSARFDLELASPKMDEFGVKSEI